MSFQCAKCERPLYNRRRVTCEFCGALIPAHDRLNATQRAAIDRLKAIERRKHHQFMESNSGMLIIPGIGPMM